MLFPTPFHVFTISRLNSAGAFRSDDLAACSTAFRSATEENESGGHVAVACPSNVKHSVVAVRIGWNSSDVTRLV